MKIFFKSLFQLMLDYGIAALFGLAIFIVISVIILIQANFEQVAEYIVYLVLALVFLFFVYIIYCGFSSDLKDKMDKLKNN